MNILRKFLSKLFLVIYPDSQIKKKSLDTSEICKVKNPKLIHLVAPFMVKPRPGICTKRDNIILAIKKYCP